MKKHLLFLCLSLTFISAFSQVGINTETPQRTLHIDGSLQVTGELNVGGDGITAGDAGTAGQVLVSKGADEAPAWENPLVPTVAPAANGTVIAIDGELKIAQEITVQMSADFTTTLSGAVPIGNLDVEIIDNESSYTGNSTSNSFTVSEDGVYQVIMNFSINAEGNRPVVGIWDNDSGNWIARVNDSYTAHNTYPVAGAHTQTYTLITSVSMQASGTYSFRVANGAEITVFAISSGSTGSGPVTQAMVKRLR